MEEKYSEARERFAGIPADKYDLGDYVLYFSGLALAREGRRDEAAACLDNLAGSFPDSYLVPYLSHELAYRAAVDNDVPAARPFFGKSRGKVTGPDRKAEEGYVAARLMEENGDPLKAAEAHLENFSSWPAHDGALLSMERLWDWRREGKLLGWGASATFLGKLAKGLARSAESDRAGVVYEEALGIEAPADDHYSILLDYAEFLRKRKETVRSKSLLAKAMKDAPASFRSEVSFLDARVDWKAGRLEEARKAFLSIARNALRKGTAERAGYFAASIAEEQGDVAAATDEYGRLRDARDEQIRQESIFRHAFGLYGQKRYTEAIEAFHAGESTGFSSVEKARHAYWRAVALSGTGRGDEGEAILRTLATDPGAGPYALFALRRDGKDPYAMINAPSSGETRTCGEEKERLWAKVRTAGWAGRDAERVSRAERLVSMGIVEYAIREAEQVDRTEIRRAIGLADGGTAGLFRYLAGDLRGGIRESGGVPNDPKTVELIDRIQFPLAPEYVGDCDRRKSGIDPLLLHAIIRQESLFQPNALSSAGAVGLMQLMPRTAAETAQRERMKKPRKKDLLRPSVNVALGAAYFSRLVREYRGDYLRAVAAYNAGESAVARWWEGAGGDPALFLEGVRYRETRFYLRRVFFNLLQYYQIYRPQMFERYFPTPPKEAAPVPGYGGSPPAGEGPAAPNGTGPPGDGKPGG